MLKLNSTYWRWGWAFWQVTVSIRSSGNENSSRNGEECNPLLKDSRAADSRSEELHNHKIFTRNTMLTHHQCCLQADSRSYRSSTITKYSPGTICWDTTFAVCRQTADHTEAPQSQGVHQEHHVETPPVLPVSGSQGAVNSGEQISERWICTGHLSDIPVLKWRSVSVWTEWSLWSEALHTPHYHWVDWNLPGGQFYTCWGGQLPAVIISIRCQVQIDNSRFVSSTNYLSGHQMSITQGADLLASQVLAAVTTWLRANHWEGKWNQWL